MYLKNRIIFFLLFLYFVLSFIIFLPLSFHFFRISLFRFVLVDFVLLSLVSFHFVSFLLISFRFVSFSLISFRFVSFRFYFVSHFIGTQQNVAITEKDRIKSPLKESLFSSSFIISPKKIQNRRDSFFLFPRTIPDLDRLSKLIVMTSSVETFKTVVSSIKYETYIFKPATCWRPSVFGKSRNNNNS